MVNYRYSRWYPMPLPDAPFEFRFAGIACRQGAVVEPPVVESWKVEAAWSQPFGVGYILLRVGGEES